MANAKAAPNAAAGATGCTTICIVKALSGPSCQNYASQSTPPAYVRVFVHDTATTGHVVAVAFETYVENTLPNEWIPSWDGEALKAGAVAVTSYAWFWVTHFGGYYQTPANCFDLTDDTNFQVYRAGSAQTRTNDAVTAVFPAVSRVNSQVRQAFYRASLTSAGSKEACGAGADGTTMSQYGSQACAEAGDAYQTILATYYAPSTLVPNDFSGGDHSQPAAFEPATGRWFIVGAAGSPFSFGADGDIPQVTNAGNGLARLGVYRPSTGTWYVSDASLTAIATRLRFGEPGDVPVASHYRGASQPSVIAVFRPSTGTWYKYTAGSVAFGSRGDVPVPGHYSPTAAVNDFVDTPAVFRPSTGTWYVLGQGPLVYGQSGDVPVPADYNGDGTTDFAVYRPVTGQWFVRGHSPVTYGVPGDVPVTGDFNGDGRADIAIYRPSTGEFFIRGQGVVTTGVMSGVPIGQAPYRD